MVKTKTTKRGVKKTARKPARGKRAMTGRKKATGRKIVKAKRPRRTLRQKAQTASANASA